MNSYKFMETLNPLLDDGVFAADSERLFADPNTGGGLPPYILSAMDLLNQFINNIFRKMVKIDDLIRCHQVFNIRLKNSIDDRVIRNCVGISLTRPQFSRGWFIKDRLRDDLFFLID